MKVMYTFIKFFFIFFFCINTCAQYGREDWNDRDTWMRVSELMELAKIEENDQVADIGCHEGYLTMHLSKRVGAKGSVFAVDIASNRLKRLNSYLEEQKITNVHTVLGDDDDPKLPPRRLDAIMVVDTYHEISEYETVLQHIKQSLKPDGLLLILEKLKAPHKEKGRAEQANAHTLSLHYVRDELEDAGFLVLNEITDWGTWNHEPEKQMWVIIAMNKVD